MAYNKGDTVHVILNYTVNGVPIEEAGVDEIELTIGSSHYTLSDGDIVLTDGKYEIFLDQKDTFALDANSRYQLRCMKDGEVGSTEIDIFALGKALSRKVLGEDDGS